MTGERIHDKIAASKKKGIWMGGTIPLGYDVHESRPILNPTEAVMACHIFWRYLELGSVRDVVTLLGMEGWRVKVQIRASGPHRGGVASGRGGILHLLSNRIYRGEIVHKGVSYLGEHESIVPEGLWDAVQAKLGTRDRAGTSVRCCKTSSSAPICMRTMSISRFACVHWLSGGHHFSFPVERMRRG